mgnify:CR=1 FL=1
MTDIDRARLTKLINEASDAAERILDNLKRINSQLDGQEVA